ncbi:MAG: polysaccharide pyruvyl transferase family protein [Clostridia bacterium]|nr:polysaccharide pyruvyl transferase family protein [Clostridia bacterium]
MKDIGILTFTRAINYGAVLQAYALKTVLSAVSDAELIHYKSPHLERLYHAFPRTPAALLHAAVFAKRNRRFRAFSAEISSPEIYDEKSITRAPYARLVVGSDQVWNLACTGADLAYLPLGMPQKRTYAYAASFGLSRLPNEQIPLFCRALSALSLISVREKTGVDICREQLGLDATVALDPTLLLTADEWRTFAAASEEKKTEKYLLLYTLGGDGRIKRAAATVAHALGLPVYNLTVSARERFGDRIIRDAGPREFVSLFASADFVVTDSFHGTAFSLNFGLPFYSFAQNDRASRILDLLDTVGLPERVNPSKAVLASPTLPDLAEAHARLVEEREKSQKIIEKIAKDGKQK